jgi:ligand-binding SRPBCC domain-containing protein
MGEGSLAMMTFWMGPVPIPWTALHVDVTQEGFTDIQLKGPFTSWIHKHKFIPQTATRTTVLDIVEVEFGTQFPKNLVSRLMWFSLPILFRYRKWQTSRLIRKNHSFR